MGRVLNLGAIEDSLNTAALNARSFGRGAGDGVLTVTCYSARS
jgi:hypothetical protein